MAMRRIVAEASIPAPAERVYALIADYHDGHQRILPRPPFLDLAVEQGGRGAGTLVRFRMRLAGRVQTFHGAISEPSPGRVLAETVRESGAVTTFTVEPRGQGCHVTIATETPVRDGLLGRLEGWMAARMLQPVYVRELALLAAAAQG